MCIALLSTAHPAYAFILLSNRDEFLTRPTARAHWWDAPNGHVLGGRDLQRAERGSWLGITKQGRIAVLTNFRDEGAEVARDKSRGAIVNAYLTVPPEQDETEQTFAKRLIDQVGIHDVGGFSLLYGHLSGANGLSIISNRTASPEDLVKIGSKTGETHGLSNSHYGDRTWPKVVRGEELLNKAIQADIKQADSPSQDSLVESLFDVLSVDTLPRHQGEGWDLYTRQLRNSILIPPVGGEAVENNKPTNIASASGTDEHVKVGQGSYATQKQTVILVGQDGKVTFVERTLFDEYAHRLPSDDMQRRFEFSIEGWDRQA